jgi:hypothetical protein
MSDKTFAEVQGAPAVEHKKALARKAKQEAKKAKKEKVIYTMKDGKILQVKIKPNGAYSTYIGTKSKMKNWKDIVATYQKAGTWVSEENYEEFVAETIEKLAEE